MNYPYSFFESSISIFGKNRDTIQPIIRILRVVRSLVRHHWWTNQASRDYLPEYIFEAMFPLKDTDIPFITD